MITKIDGVDVSRRRKERRVKLLLVEDYVLLDLLSNWRHCEFVCLPVIKGLPDDYEILHVNNDYARAGFVFAIWSQEFDIVPDGACAEYFDPIRESVSLRLVNIPTAPERPKV